MFSLPASGARHWPCVLRWICCAQKEYVRGCFARSQYGRSRRKHLSVLPGKLTDCMPRSLTWGRWHRNLKNTRQAGKLGAYANITGSRYIRKRSLRAVSQKRKHAAYLVSRLRQWDPYARCYSCDTFARPEQGQGMYRFGHRLLVKSRRIYELQHGAHHSRPRDPVCDRCEAR